MTWWLVADVGGTNIRFACATADGLLINRQDFRTGDFASFDKALDAYLSGLPKHEAICSVSVAAAGRLNNGAIALTNGTWTLRADDIGRRFGGAKVTLINDLQAAALSIPNLKPEHLYVIGKGRGEHGPAATRLAVNVGTGFGASALVHSSQGWISLPSEAGHISLPTLPDGVANASGLSAQVFESIEDVLSGSGMVRLYQHLSVHEFATLSQISSPQDVLNRKETDPIAQLTVDTFTRLFASVCGNLVLATAAWGGVFLFGSVAREWADHADKALFMEEFPAKGKMAVAMQEVSVSVVTDLDAPLHGLAAG